MIRSIVVYPDPILTKPSQPVAGKPDDELVRDMLDTMEAIKGKGLAAVQIGVPLNLFVIKKESGDYFIAVNPTKVVYAGDQRDIKEGCLSMPGVFEVNKRHTKVSFVTVEDGVEYPHQFENEAAFIVAHEMEHLAGEVFIKDPKLLKRVTNRLTKWKAKGWIYPPNAGGWIYRAHYT